MTAAEKNAEECVAALLAHPGIKVNLFDKVRAILRYTLRFMTFNDPSCFMFATTQDNDTALTAAVFQGSGAAVRALLAHPEVNVNAVKEVS